MKAINVPSNGTKRCESSKGFLKGFQVIALRFAFSGLGDIKDKTERFPANQLSMNCGRCGHSHTVTQRYFDRSRFQQDKLNSFPHILADLADPEVCHQG